jgi:chromosome segregation ATPase
MEISTDIILGIVGVLLGVLGKMILSKLDKGNEQIATLTTEIAVLKSQFNNHDELSKKNESDLVELKEKFHQLGNQVNMLQERFVNELDH